MEIIEGSSFIFWINILEKVTLSASINFPSSSWSTSLIKLALCFLYFSRTVFRCELIFSVLKVSSLRLSVSFCYSPTAFPFSLSDSIGVELSPSFSCWSFFFFFEGLFLTLKILMPPTDVSPTGCCILLVEVCRVSSFISLPPLFGDLESSIFEPLTEVILVLLVPLLNLTLRSCWMFLRSLLLWDICRPSCCSCMMSYLLMLKWISLILCCNSSWNELGLLFCSCSSLALAVSASSCYVSSIRDISIGLCSIRLFIIWACKV